MKTTRRSALFGGLATASVASIGAPGLSSCSNGEAPLKSKANQVAVIGAIHSRHRSSRPYSLDVLARAVREFGPEVVLTEIPPDRIEEAKSSFAETGEVSESRTKVFPELTDVIFPLSLGLDYEIVAAAGWTPEIARERGKNLNAIAADPARASQWAAHRQARAEFAEALKGRGDNPRFIHTLEYDALVQTAWTPYQVYFDRDLGPGGWTRINAAHTNLMNEALDLVSGQGLKVLIVFGAAHKYMIERSLLLRSDIDRIEARDLFA